MHILPSSFSVRRVANSEIQRFLKLLDGPRGDVLRANKSNDAKTSGVRIASSRQRSTASARTASAFFSSSVSKRSPFIALILRAVPSRRIECPACDMILVKQNIIQLPHIDHLAASLAPIEVAFFRFV